MYQLPQRQVHLDFHTGECIDGIGSRFDKGAFQDCLKRGHVNSITVFAKCHHGWAYFPSETNEIHPGLHGFDLLSAMLEACSEIGVAAPVYLSAGLDEKYFVKHPEHGRVAARGGRPPLIFEDDGHLFANEERARYHDICMNTPYLDILASQVREVVERFRPCGIFLDIVSERICFCPHCRRSVINAGLDETDDASYALIAKQTYRKYYETINAAARAVMPEIRIFHNGGHILAGRRELAHANTHIEMESLPTGGWGYDHFPKSARYAHMLGMEYLGMTGKFHLSWGEFGGYKHPNALRYEVALSLALGAKCSVGDQMHPYGFLDPATYDLIGIAYAEAEAVEPYCYDSTPFSDIGVISVEAVKGEKNAPSDVGLSRILLEGHYLYDILDLECDFSRYQLIILPDEVPATGVLREKIETYLASGGKVLASGASAIGEDGEFAFALGAKMRALSECRPSYYRPAYPALGLPEASYVLYGRHYDIDSAEGAEVLGYARESFFNRTPAHFCSHQHTPYVPKDHAPAVTLGRHGAYIAWDIFREYAEVGSCIQKDTAMRVIDRLLSKKTVESELPSAGVVALNDQPEEGRYVLHLLYAPPAKRGNGVEIIEDLPTLHDIGVTLRLPDVERIYTVPEMQELPFLREGEEIRFTLPSLTCKQVIVLERA